MLYGLIPISGHQSMQNVRAHSMDVPSSQVPVSQARRASTGGFRVPHTPSNRKQRALAPVPAQQNVTAQNTYLAQLLIGKTPMYAMISQNLGVCFKQTSALFSEASNKLFIFLTR